FLIGLLIFGICNSKQMKNEKIGIEENLKNLPNFSPYKTIIKSNIYGIHMGISIDVNSHQICLIRHKDFIVKPFSSILETEIIIDGSTITKTSRGGLVLGTAVGGVLGGGVGALIGGLSASTTSKE